MGVLQDFLNDLFFDFLEADGSSSSSVKRKSSDNFPYTTYGVGIALYFIVFIGIIINYIYKRKKARKKLPSMATRFFICLPLAMISRIVFFVLKIVLNLQAKEGNMDYDLDAFNSVLNRFTMCIFIFVFNTLLFYWIDTIYTTVNAAFAQEAFGGSTNVSFVTSAGQIATYIVTFFIVIVILVLDIVYEVIEIDIKHSNSEYTSSVANQIHTADNMIISIAFLIFGLCFFYFGTKLNCRIGKQDKGGLKGLWKTELFSIGLCICFIIRFVFFSYNIFTGKEIDDNVFIFFTYYVPEIIPTLLILWSINTKMFRESKTVETSMNPTDSFIDPLLEEEREDELRCNF